jgi:hypothetical protein
MANGINRVYFLIAILCIALVFTQGNNFAYSIPNFLYFCRMIISVDCINNDFISPNFISFKGHVNLCP